MLSNIETIFFTLFFVLVLLNVLFVYAAAFNTIEGNEYFPYVFNPGKLLSQELYTSKGNWYRKAALLSWALEIIILIILIW